MLQCHPSVSLLLSSTPSASPATIFTESQNSSGVHPVQPPGSPRAGDTGVHPGGFGMPPERETPYPTWAAVPGLCHTQCTEVLPHVGVELLVV